MTIKILTLCDKCAKDVADYYRVSKVQIATTTEKKTTCEWCKQRFPEEHLQQYTLASKRK